MSLKFTGEVHRINEIEARDDFAGGIQLTLADEQADITVWVPAEEAGQIRSLRRLQRVEAELRAREGSFTTSRDGASRPAKAYKFGLVSISLVDAKPKAVA